MEKDFLLSRSRREFQRFMVDAHAILVLDGSLKDIRVKNISAGGLCAIANDFTAASHKKIEVLLLKPFFQEEVKKEARLAWHERTQGNSSELGISFPAYDKIDLSNFKS